MAGTPLEDYSISSESDNWSSGEEPWDSGEEDEALPRASPGGWNIVAPNRFRPTVHAAFNSPLTVEDRRNRLGVPDLSPVQSFFEFLRPSLWRTVVQESNRYAQQSRETAWTPLTIEELYRYLAVVFVRSVRQTTNVATLWNTHVAFNCPTLRGTRPS